MRLVASLAVMVALLSTGLSASAADFKVGFVDLNRALQNVEAGKSAKASIEKEVKDKEKQIQDEGEALRKMQENLKKQSLALSDEAKAKKGAEFQERYAKFLQLREKSREELAQKERALVEPILNKLRTIVDEMGQKNGYNFILEKNENAVLFSQKKDDLTDEVIKTFNSRK